MSDARALQEAYEAKARAELAAADELLDGATPIAWSGSVFGRTMLVKGHPGTLDVREASALAGPDGEAARKALEALGRDPHSVFATIAIPPDAAHDRDAVVERLAIQIEAVDPAIVVALDTDATAILVAVARLDGLPFGEPTSWQGRILVAVDGLEASLEDEDRKKRVWTQLRALPADS